MAVDQYGKEVHHHDVRSRVKDGIGALVLAGVLYLCASVTSTERAMIKMQATFDANSATLSAIPAMTIRVVEAEKDIQKHTQEIEESKLRIRELERTEPSRNKVKPGFSL